MHILKSNRLKLGIGILIVFIALFIISGLTYSASAFQGNVPTATPTQFTQAIPTRVPGSATPGAPGAQQSTRASVRASGTIASASQATLAFQAAGRIKEIKFKEGDRIKAGTVIGSLDSTTSLDAQVASASSALDKVKAGPTADDVAIAKSSLDRAKAAVDQAQAAYDKLGGGTNPAIAITAQALTLQQATSAFQSAVASYNIAVNHPTPQELTAAQATLEAAKLTATNARITAPFDATVLWIGVRAGESTTAGTASLAIADLSHMQVIVNVDEVAAAGIKAGQSATITVDAFPGKQFKGKVSKVALLGIATNNLVTVPVTVDIDPADTLIYPGLSATVEITTTP